MTQYITVQFLCKVSQLEDPLIFDFKDSNTLTKVIDYIKDHDDLKPLLRHTIDERTERRKAKGTYRLQLLHISILYFSFPDETETSSPGVSLLGEHSLIEKAV